MTALQDWLGLRPVDQGTIGGLVRWPLRMVLGIADTSESEEFTTMCAGVERC